jgi:hypothetical protein
MSKGDRLLLDQEEKEKRVKNEGALVAKELETYMNEYDYPPDAMLTLAAADVEPETMARFWLRLERVHLRSTGRPLRLCSVMAASKTGLPHIHGVPQRPQDVDMALLERVCAASGYSIKMSNPMAEQPGRDARNYVAGHLKRTGFKKVPPKVIMGEGIQTSHDKTQADRCRRREQRKETRRRRAAMKRAANEASAPHASEGAWLAQNDTSERVLHIAKVGAVKPLFVRLPRETRVNATTIRRRRLG